MSAYLVATFRRDLKEAGYASATTSPSIFDGTKGSTSGYQRLQSSWFVLGVIVATGGDPAAQATKAATTTIPIVFVSGRDR